MAEIEEAIYTRLTGHAGVSGLVGTRVYPEKMPQEPTYPSLVYRRISLIAYPAMSTDADVETTPVQVSCFADTYLGLIGLAREVRNALQRFRGTVSGVEITDCMLVNMIDLYEETIRVHHRAIDFDVHHR